MSGHGLSLRHCRNLRETFKVGNESVTPTGVGLTVLVDCSRQSVVAMVAVHNLSLFHVPIRFPFKSHLRCFETQDLSITMACNEDLFERCQVGDKRILQLPETPLQHRRSHKNCLETSRECQKSRGNCRHWDGDQMTLAPILWAPGCRSAYPRCAALFDTEGHSKPRALWAEGSASFQASP